MDEVAPGLSDSDVRLTTALAGAPDMRTGLARLGPVPDDLTPLLEAFVVFLRHAPAGALNPPPALWAIALVVRHTAVLHGILRDSHPDLAQRLAQTLAGDAPFFGGNYPWARSRCLAVAYESDGRLWPYRSEDLDPPKILPHLWKALAAILLGWALLPALVFLAFFVGTLAILGAWALALGARDFWRRTRSGWRKTLPRTPEIMHQALAHALGVETRTMRMKRELAFSRVDFGLTTTTFVVMIVQALI